MSDMPDHTGREPEENVDSAVVDDFGREWKAFSQKKLIGDELAIATDEYFRIFPFESIDQSSVGFDMGCGSGRWAKSMASRVRTLRCIDPSILALEQAKNNLSDHPNCEFECASVSKTTLPEGSQDFGYCLGVLHHVPDTLAGLKSCTRKLKKGAPFLLYLYYRFDNKPAWFRLIWKCSDYVRRVISRLPFPVKLLCSQIIATTIYWPLARAAGFLEMIGFNVINLPLSTYRDKSFYFMRTDALDRFGTKLEQRFTKIEIEKMMSEAGLVDVRFSDRPPFWVAVGVRS